MPNVYAACWTMNTNAFAGNTTSDRVDTLENIAISANRRLRSMGRAAGGVFSRMLVVPEYVFTAGGTILSRNDKHRIYRRLEDISARVPRLILIAGSIAYKKGTFHKDTYNVCPSLFGGQIVKKLYKADDDGVYQVNGTFRTKTDGGKGAPLATINGLSIGLDICMDLNNSRLGNYLAAHHLGRPDIHVQISGSNANSRTFAEARVGGVYIHCDLGGLGANGASAWRVTAQPGGNWGATTTRINPTRTLVRGGGRLMLFDTPI